MVLTRVAVSLAVLGHDVQDVFPNRPGAADGLADAVDQEIGDDAGIEAPRPDDDDIRLTDGVDAVLKRLRVLRHKAHLPDAAVVDLLCVENLALSERAGAVVEFRLQIDVLIRHRKDASRDGKDLSHPLHRLVKRTGDAVHRRKEQIAEALPREAPLGEAVVQQLAHRLFRVGQRQNAAPDIAGRQHPEILAQRAGASVRVGEYGETVFFFHI